MTRQQDLRTQLNSVREELMRLKQFIDSLRFSSDEHAIWLLVRLRMGSDITQVVNVKTPRLNKGLELGDVHAPDIAPQSNIADTLDAGTSYVYAQKEIYSDQFWQDTLQPCLLNHFTWLDVSNTFS